MTNQRGLRHTIAGLAVLTAAAAAHAQDEPINTDRPDFSESSQTVGEGRFQIETSVAHERDRQAGMKTTTFRTPTLLRYGISPALELRLESDGWTRQKTRDEASAAATTERGMSDTAIGVKWHSQDNQGAVPSIAWLVHADLDTGSRAFRGRGVRPSLRAVLEWELTDGISVGLMPGVVWDTTDTGHRHATGILGTVVGKEWTDRFRTFAELAAERIASSRNGGSTLTYGAGAAYLLTRDVQVDTAVSLGANRNAPDVAWTAGLSVRF